MTEFKVGDQVKMRKGAVSYYGTDVGGLTGEVTMVYAKDMAVLLTGVSGNKIVKFGDAIKIEEVHNVKTEDEKIDKALEKTKKDGGYCGDFDRAVERAKNLPLVERLKFVAQDMGEMDIFHEFEANLKAMNAPFEALPTPAEGDYITAVTKDGETHTGTVTQVGTITDSGTLPYVSFLINNKWSVICTDRESFDYYSNVEPHNVLTSWEYTAKPVKIPEVGRWIKATTKDGKTHEFEVTKNSQFTSVKDECVVLTAGGIQLWVGPGNSLWTTEDHAHIVSWKYIEKPANSYKVGDVVPARTGLDRDWYGERTDGIRDYFRSVLPRDAFSDHPRKILWIEE